MSALLLAVLASADRPDRVVVFLDQAQVTRVTTISCGEPTATTFPDIPLSADRGSFRAQVKQGVVTAVRPELVVRETPGPDTQRLQAQREALQREAAALRDRVALAEAQARAADRYHDLSLELIAKDLASATPETKAWQSALDASLKSSLEASTALAQLAASQRGLHQQLDEVSGKLERLRADGDRHAWTVEVLAACSGSATAELALTYRVGGASWAPAYEARADEAKGAVELQTWATITQRTGEPWNQVELVLSSADPVPDATLPARTKLIVQGTEREPEQKVLVRREESAEHAKTGAANAATSGLQPQGLSVQLPLPGRPTVPADASPVRVAVGTTRLPATFEWRVMPRAAPVAFRVAEVTNQTGWALLPGELDAFRGSALMGRYQLERVAAGAPFTLSFGADEALRVKRVTLEELHHEPGFLQARHRFSSAYRFELRSTGRGPIDVVLSDHLPVSELSDLRVNLSEKTTPGYQLRPEDGIARWRVTVKPGEVQRVELAFVIDVPSSYDVSAVSRQ